MKSGKETQKETHKITYDITSTPNGLNLEEVFKIFNSTGVLIFDSKRGNKPEVIHMIPRRKLKFMDSNDLNIKKVKEILDEAKKNIDG